MRDSLHHPPWALTKEKAQALKIKLRRTGSQQNVFRVRFDGDIHLVPFLECHFLAIFVFQHVVDADLAIKLLRSSALFPARLFGSLSIAVASELQRTPRVYSSQYFGAAARKGGRAIAYRGEHCTAPYLAIFRLSGFEAIGLARADSANLRTRCACSRSDA